MRLFSVVYLAVFVGLVGCSGNGGSRIEVAPVSGTVKYNGAAVADATISFSTTARSASGQTNAQGEYKLTTFDTDDGAVPGDHVVTIIKLVGSDGNAIREMTKEDLAKTTNPTADFGKLLKGQLPEKYGDPKKSGLKRTVVKGQTNSFNFDLKD